MLLYLSSASVPAFSKLLTLIYPTSERDRHLQEVTRPQENPETSRRESDYFSSKRKIPLTIMEFNHHYRYHEICKEDIPKNLRAINSAITQLSSCKNVVKINNVFFRSKNSKSGHMNRKCCSFSPISYISVSIYICQVIKKNQTHKFGLHSPYSQLQH